MARIQHHFDVNIATELGIVEAILVNNFQYWIAQNIANGRHFYDGRYWTYNSVQAYSKYFPYLSHDKIRRAIDKLVSKGVLVKGNYNKDPKDRTSWYALSEEYVPIWQGSQDDLANLPIASGKNAEPIPYSNNIYGKTDNKEDNYSKNKSSHNISSTSKKEKKEGFDLSFVSVSMEDIFNQWLAYKRAIGDTYKTQQGVELCYRKLVEMSKDDPHTAQLIVEQSIANNWKGLFELKSQSNGINSTKTQQSRNRFCDLADSIKAAGGIF